MTRHWRILLFCALLVACTALPRAPDTADVIVYRTAAPVGPVVPVYIYDNNRLVGTLGRGYYLHLKLPPGPLVLKVLAPETGAIPYATTLTVGQTYYLMTYFRGLGAIGELGLLPQDPARATSAMKQLQETVAAGHQP